MLQSLTVKNFAIIDNIQIDFSSGMTVLTGETGAGKSLIIDAIGLLFGDRASSDQVRHGETKAFIEGVFTRTSNVITEILASCGIANDEFLIIRREIYANGKSLSKVNGETISLSALNDLSSELGDIHTQFDAMKLVNPRNYYDFIDNQEVKNLLTDYQANLKEFRVLNNLYLEKKKNIKEEMQRLDYLKYQVNELSNANLQLSEELDLQNQLKISQNHEKIASNYRDFLNVYDCKEVLSNLHDSIASLKKNALYDESLNEKVNSLEEAYYNILDVYETVKNKFANADFDDDNFDKINERLSVYSQLKRKYKMTIAEIIDYLAKIKIDVEQLENFDFYLEELIKEKDIFYHKTLKIGENISEIRKQNALELKRNLLGIFSDLSLKNTRFEISFAKDSDEAVFKNNGLDILDFLISFNLGEPLKPLSKVASGGELSRFMLALKSVSCDEMNSKTFIFDEIDSGVSGEIAYCIASKMKDIALKHQVLCVTHLPQVASISDYHLNITKEIIDSNRTISVVNTLSLDQRIEAIASMISNGQKTETSIALAKELLLQKK